MIDVKEAVQRAKRYLAELYPDVELQGVLLEEVEVAPDEGHWYVTLSFASPLQVANPFATLGGATRLYKIFTIRMEDGVVQSMKIREI